MGGGVDRKLFSKKFPIDRMATLLAAHFPFL